MYTAKIQNASGDVLVLTGKEPVYQVIDIQGLNPAKAQVNTTPLYGVDGADFNSSKIGTKNIVLKIKINGDVETNRLALYQYIKPKEWCRFFYANEHRNVYIDGYVETFECGLFTKSETAQVSIICPSPYFKDINESVVPLSNVTGAFTFPFSINDGEPIPISDYDESTQANVFNNSESEVGTIIKILVNEDISFVKLRNTATGEDFTLNYPFFTGDEITINTNTGKKSVSLLRDAVTTNIFIAVKKGSVFFQLHAGSNPFTYLTSGGGVSIQFYFSKAYRGV